ncbi:MAG: LptA/OstA family protein [Rhodospirillales bacterium]|nr:LptA/OstA family protein [Rhodospirillales bacterium]
MLVLTLAAVAPAAAQQVGKLGSDEGPIEILADQGIEWRRSEKLYIARGNASAKRGDFTVFADVLTAYYRERRDGSSEIYRIDAVGKVRMQSPNETAYSDNGVYDADRGLLLLRGDDLRFITQQEVIRARDTLEYWETEEVAVARGDASAVREDREIMADVLTAYFTPNVNQELEMTTLKADGNVRVKTPREFAQGDSGVYYIEHELVTLTNNVKLTRGENQMNGEYAEVNLETGISRMLGGPPGQTGDTRVRSLLVPGSESDNGGGS